MGIAASVWRRRNGCERRRVCLITGRRDSELAAAVGEIGRDVTGVQGDVSNLNDLDRLFAQIKREKGKLDIVFANADAAQYAPSARSVRSTMTTLDLLVNSG